VWDAIWAQLDANPAARERVVTQSVVFLDEYFGALPSYYHWAWRTLRVDRDGFSAAHIHLPRGLFFESGQIVSSTRLEEILREHPADWKACTVAGEQDSPPEIRITPDATHPVLKEIGRSLYAYECAVQLQNRRLQLLGIGVGGAIATNPQAGGHIGFVECGAAASDTGVMLVRTAPSTRNANRDDFLLHNGDGPATFEPALHAVTQGIGSILSASHLLMAAWGQTKRAAVERMLLGTPGPLNPAAWVQTHQRVTVCLDPAAFGTLPQAVLHERGWEVEFQSSA